MEKSEYFGKVIKLVTELTDVDEADIIGCSRRSDVVYAQDSGHHRSSRADGEPRLGEH